LKTTPVRQRWQLPPNGWSKCNVDAAFDANAGQGGEQLFFGLKMVFLAVVVLDGTPMGWML